MPTIYTYSYIHIKFAIYCTMLSLTRTQTLSWMFPEMLRLSLAWNDASATCMGSKRRWTLEYVWGPQGGPEGGLHRVTSMVVRCGLHRWPFGGSAGAPVALKNSSLSTCSPHVDDSFAWTKAAPPCSSASVVSTDAFISWCQLFEGSLDPSETCKFFTASSAVLHWNREADSAKFARKTTKWTVWDLRIILRW